MRTLGLFGVFALSLASTAHAVCTNLTGLWAGGAALVTVSTGVPPLWYATLPGTWDRQVGAFTPANSSLSFSCCGGIWGRINDACDTISWDDANQDVWVRTQGGTSASVSSPLLTVGLGATGAAASLNAFSFYGAGANTTNFALASGDATQNGGTLLVPAGLRGSEKGAVSAVCGASCNITSSSSTATMTGLTLSIGGTVVATESWVLTLLNESAFALTVARVWSGAGPPLAVDRVAFSFQTTGGLPIHSQQIPGFVDLSMFLNDTSTGGFDIGNSEFEFLSPSSRQLVRFTPTGALFVVEGAASVGGVPAPALFSFAKPFGDGTAWCSIGFEMIDPRVGVRPALAAGTLEAVSVIFHLLETDVPMTGPGASNFPALSVALPNATLLTSMNVLFNTQYQLMGWIMGNNPASVPCLHEMAWWPLMASTLDAGSVAFDAMQRELSFFASCGWSPEATGTGVNEYITSCNGVAAGGGFGLTHRYASTGFYNSQWGPFQDENVMFPIAVYYAAASSGDLAWLASLRPAIDAMMAYFSAHGLNASADPALFTSPSSGLADGGRHASNWYDVVLFGHRDAYIAVHAVWALGCVAEIYAALGDAPAAAAAAALHARATADFNSVFWNATARAYADWIDSSGRARYYFYSDIAFVSILAGVADAAQAAALLTHYDERLAEIYTSLNVTPGAIWSAPCNLYPITDQCEFANGGGGKCPREGGVDFPSYENGGSFFHTPGLQFAALGAAGRADDAYEGFVALMSSGFGEIRGWAQQLYWGTGGKPDALVGGDPLNTAVLPIWGFLRAAFGVAHTLKGLVVVNEPAAKAVGAVWNTSYLGESVCLTVQGSPLRTTFCNGSAL